MSARRVAASLVRLYPAAWRVRYGVELETLIVETSGGRVGWRTRIDVVRAAARERLRAGGLSPDGPPSERMRGGAVVVLGAWALFALAGAAVQKFSEHWQDATPAASRGLPAGAFDTLVAAAAVGTALVLAGVVAALPTTLRFLRSGGVLRVRRYLLAAVGSTSAAVPLTVALVVVAHRLTERQRSGHDLRYAALALAWALVALACFVAWTALGVAIARRIELRWATLRLEALLAAGVTLTMAAMTCATAVWWAALARSAPWFLGGLPPGAHASTLPPALVGAQACMLAATAAAAAGASHALRAARAAR